MYSRLGQVFMRLLNNGIQSTMTFAEVRDRRILNGICIILFVFSFVLLLPLPFMGDSLRVIEVLVLTLATVIPAIFIYWCIRRNYFSLAKGTTFLFFGAFLVASPWLIMTYAGLNYHFMAILSGVVLMYNSRKALWWMFWPLSLAFVVSTYFHSQPNLAMQFAFDEVQFWINAFFAVLMLYFVLIAFKNESKMYLDQVEEQKAELAEKNKQISDSIRYAKGIQQAMLPPLPLIEENFKESFVYFRPRDVVSGDFFWFAQVEGKKIIAAIDCTGHGVPGAFMSLIANEILNDIVNQRLITSPDLILTELNHAIRKTLKQEEGQNQDGMEMSLLVIDPLSRVAEMAGAKNPVLYTQGGELYEVKGDKKPIGGKLHSAESRFQKTTILVPEEACFYMFSDGYADQFGGPGPERKKFMSRNLRQLLSDIHHLPMKEQLLRVQNTFVQWMGKHRQMDDVLVVGVKV